ncbi:hypothetical protein P43SY_008798 [Pythium insidiosum]|uniref:Coiled-coil domain-containing protein 40 n=1 Tax=Pythium insidiosum TaxID=114742 RepID=A0AAD5QCL0_PYTIN|nr:hypothetical protein P43SY_008798 [Pythium insidiosum]
MMPSALNAGGVSDARQGKEAVPQEGGAKSNRVDSDGGDGRNEDNEDDEDQEDDNDEEEEEEEEDGDPTQTIVDIGRHARMQRIQKVLYEQLVGNDDRMSLELREKEEELRRVKQTREDIGVSLYSVQQQLAQLQMALEGAHRKLNVIHDERFKAEDQLDDWKENLNGKKIDVEKNRSHLYKAQSELDSLNVTLRQVEKYNEEMKHEIARTQRAAHKAEETMSNMEKDKVKQDLYIDSLNEQVKVLNEKIAMNVAQLKSQKLETQAADETLREAAKQMEAVAFEKKQLLQQWKSSLIGLQQRDQALQATQTAISTITEEDLAVASEIRGYKHSIEKAQALHETLTATIERFNAEIRFVEEQIGSLHQEHDRLAERQEQMLQDMEQAIHKRDLIAMRGRSKKDAELTYASLTTKVSTLQNNLRKTEKEISKLDKQVRQRMVSCEDIGFQLEKATAELRVDEERGSSLQKAINNALYEKQRYVDAESRKLRLLKRLEGLKKGTGNPTDDSKVLEECAKAQDGVERIKQVIALLQQQNPHLNEVLMRVAMLAEEPPV